MNEIEQKLWAEVYAAEYARLAARIAAYEKRDGEHSWQYGSACDGNEAAAIAKTTAYYAVEQFRAAK